jgi:two-component system, OmpR family, response regulator
VKFLFCDDDPVIRYLLEVLLSKRGGHDIVSVADPRAVLEQALDTQPDIILLDYVMPGLTGMEVVFQLRARTETKQIPVVFLTGRTDVADVESLEALGIKGVVEKPFDTATFIERLLTMADR